jgi:hypothetical protein
MFSFRPGRSSRLGRLLCTVAMEARHHDAMVVVRYGIPLALFVAGAVVAGTSGSGVAAGAMFISAATAVLLLNVLHRIGVQGDRDRDREEDARRFFDEHGRWPDEPASAARRPHRR